MSENLNELFAELKAEIYKLRGPGAPAVVDEAEKSLYFLDWVINNGEFARAEQDAVS